MGAKYKDFRFQRNLENLPRPTLTELKGITCWDASAGVVLPQATMDSSQLHKICSDT